MALPIYVYGSGALFQEGLNAIAAVMGGGAFQSLVKLSLLLAAFLVCLKYVTGRDILVFGRFFLWYVVIFYALFLPKTQVEIVDSTQPAAVYSVDNVPLALGAGAYLTTSLGHGLTELLDSVFTMPDYLPYTQTGFLMASQLVQVASQFEIQDPEFRASLDSFMHQCVFYDLLLDQYTVSDLIKSQDIWGLVSQHASPARAFLLNNTVTTCQDGVRVLNQQWKEAFKTTQRYYATRLFGNTQEAEQSLLTYLPLSYAYLAHVSSSGSEILQQNLMANALYNGLQSYAVQTNSASSLIDYTTAKAQLQKRIANVSAGQTAGYWLTLTQNVLLLTLFGMFIFVFLFSVLPAGFAVVKHYFYSLLWIQMWAPLYAMMNFAISFYAQHKSLGVATGGLTLSSQAGLATVNADIAGVAGFLLLSVPFLAVGIVRGMSGVFLQLSQSIMSASQSNMASAAADAATGNISVGNMSYQNTSGLSNNLYKYDSTVRMQEGSWSQQLADGTQMTTMMNGQTVFNTSGAISSLPISVNWADSISRSASLQADHSLQAAASSAQSFNESVSQAARTSYDLSHAKGVSESGSDGYTVTNSSSVNESLRRMASLDQKYAQEHGISDTDAHAVLVDASLRGGLGVNTPLVNAGGSMQMMMSNNVSHEMADRFSHAKDFVTQTSYAKDFQTLQSAAHDQSFRATTEEGQRLVESLSGSLETAQQSAQSYSASLQEAQSYREVASKATSNSSNINENANQHFVEWMAQQQAPNDTGKLGAVGAEAVLMQDPQLGKVYAQQFVEQKTQQMVQDALAEKAPQVVQKAFEQDVKKVPSAETFKKTFESEQDKVIQEAAKKGIQKDLIDKEVKPAVEKNWRQTRDTLKKEREGLEKEGMNRMIKED